MHQQKEPGIREIAIPPKRKQSEIYNAPIFAKINLHLFGQGESASEEFQRCHTSVIIFKLFFEIDAIEGAQERLRDAVCVL